METNRAAREGIFEEGTFELENTHPTRKHVECKPVREVTAGRV